MRQVSIGGQVYEINEREYYSMVGSLAGGYLTSAEIYLNMHVSGFPDWRGSFDIPDVGQYELVKSIEDQIDDDELSIAFNSLIEQFQELREIDRELIRWLAGYVGLPSALDKKDRAKLERRLKKIIISGPGGGPAGPVWAMHPEYKGFVKRSKKILDGMNKINLQIKQRIQQLTEGM